MSAISQLQMNYDAEEDRILLRVNTTAADEFRFWLTRRYCQLIVQALNAQRAADPDIATQPTPDAREAVQSFKQEAAGAQGDFQQEFKPSDSFPLGDEPVVAYRLSYGVKAGKLKVSIQPKSGQGIDIVFDETLNFNVTRLLKAASDKGNWGLDWGAMSVEVPEKRVIN